MRFENLGALELPHFDLASLRLEGYFLLLLYLVTLSTALFLRRGDFKQFRGRTFAIFFLLLLISIPLNNALWLRFPVDTVLPPPSVPADPPAPSVPLLGALPIFLAAALFGAGPSMVVGLVAGLTRGGLDSSRVFAPAELAALGLLVGFMLQQAYQGRVWRLLRQPSVVGLVGAGWHWVLLGTGIFAATNSNSLSALDYTRSLLLASIGAVVIDGVFSGILIQALYYAVPRFKPSTKPPVVPPHMRSMHRRLLVALIPLTLVMMLAVFTAVTTTAIEESTNQVIDRMIDSADGAAKTIPLFFNTGQELLTNLAAAEQLRRSDSDTRQELLEENLRLGPYGPFFTQLILVDKNGVAVNYYPNDQAALELGSEEEKLVTRTLQFGSPERTGVYERGTEYLVSFIAPVEDENSNYVRALVGRTQLSANPVIKNLYASLEGLGEADAGFVVDETGFIAIHPDQKHLLQAVAIDLECPEIAVLSNRTKTLAKGTACEGLDPEDGTRRLIYYLPVQAMGTWTVVFTYPYDLVLERATRISGQVLLILLVITGVLTIAVPWLTSRLTRPLQLLSTAARNITEGQLDNQVTLTGEDEVGQLGRAFEQMRLSLKGRLDDLSLLLRVSQAVSSHLDMTEGIPTILNGALQATDARLARLILLDERGDPQVVMSQGEGSGSVTALDRAMARLGQRGTPVKIENIARAKGLIDPALAGPEIKAVIAVPMRSQEHDIGVMWLGYGEVHHFSDTEVGFLSTLTSQAAVAVENARLFQAAEGGRRRLAAILESTSDAVIVTDHANRVLLLNAAAAELFRTDALGARGKPISLAIEQAKVIQLLTMPMNNGVPLTDEVPLGDGRTLFASASAIVSGDGQTIGRVAVLHDITYLKALDEMKSDFVATVSHDLRAPLTFMRGYATMIPMVGEVTPKQKQYVEKIMVGIEQMTELIDDLLDLGRIETGVDLRSEPSRLDEIIVSQVDAMQPQAKAKGILLRLDRTEDITIVVGDASLLRRVISNLVDNAIKYTPDGGTVTVSWETRNRSIQVAVADTGIGIAKSDHVRLFEKFSRIPRRETINIKGSGLGLAIVKSIVERHRGRVWVESELGQGSTFYVELPVGEIGSI